MSAALQSPMGVKDKAQSIETIVYFPRSYTGETYIILGSFVLETIGSAEEAISMSKRYQEAAKRCNKPVELIPTDSSFQTHGLHIDEWYLKRFE
tara:strand:+ start:1084 stop:1365 length:282 start_codon:yes stop_codon:yes gene_type:complete